MGLPSQVTEHAAWNVMRDPGEIERFYDCCSDLMRQLLDGLARCPDRPRTFPEIEAAIGWPRRRIASVLGGVSRRRNFEFAGRRPYHFLDTRNSESGRWEMWMDRAQASAVRGCSVSDPLADRGERRRVGEDGVVVGGGFDDLHPAGPLERLNGGIGHEPCSGHEG